MDKEFWLNRWQTNDIGFHISEANPLLVANFASLSLEKDDRIFVPLCGKTLDIAWLLSQGCCVVGVDLSEMAVQQLFAELNLDPDVTQVDGLKHYSAQRIDVYVGDVFAIGQELLGPVAAVYDRAAIVALPELMRKRYTAHIMTVTQKAQQLILSFVYDQTLMEGPPFSVTAEEIQKHYAKDYQIELLYSAKLEEGLKGVVPASEECWLLKRQ